MLAAHPRVIRTNERIYLKTLITVFSIIATIALESFCEGIPIYYFDKKQPFLFGKKITSKNGKNCRASTPDSLYNPTIRVIVKEEGTLLFTSDTSIIVDKDLKSEKSIKFKIGDTLVLQSYLGEGFWSAYFNDSKISIEYRGIESRQQQFMKELVRFNSEIWFQIDKNGSCWMKDDDPSIVETRLEF